MQASGIATTAYIVVGKNYRTDIAKYASAAQEKINTSGNLPIGMTVKVEASPIRKYAMMVRVDRETVSKEEVQGIIDNYTEWQDNTAGRAFNPERLIGDLYRAGCSSVSLSSVSGNTFTNLKFTKIEDKEHCEGTISVSYTT